MIRRSRFNFCQALFCFIVALMVMPVGFCAAQPKHSSDWAFGYEAFNLLLQESNIEICSQQEWNNTPGTDKFAIIIDDDPNIDWGPTMGGIPSLVMRSSGLCLKTRFRPRLGSVDSSQTQDFYSAADCPIVRPDSTHDVFFGVQSLVCNTPGYIAFPARDQTIIDEQLYPATTLSRHISIPGRTVFRRNSAPARRRFSILAEEPTKRAWVADPLLFSNQMLFKADNLRFADNTLRWLSDDYRRKKVILFIGGVPRDAVDPSDLDILTPIPTHEEVIEAIKKMPKGALAKFANSVVQLSEDENIYNRIAHNYADSLQDGQISRLIIFAIFTCCFAFAMVTYFWQRRILRRTASVTASRRRQNLSKREAGSAAAERQAAATLLLNSFCLEVAERRLADWPEFPTPIVSQDRQNNRQATHATNDLADAYWRLRTKPKSYWTEQTLLDLEQETLNWRQLIADEEIMLQTEYV